jgi:molybdate transport system substrate-binding protein
MESLRILSAIAVKGAFEAAILPAFEKSAKVEAEWNPTNLLMKSIAEGRRADVVVVTDEAMDGLEKSGLVEPASRVRLGSALLGVAVKAGAPKPDISTAAAFRAAMLGARSVAYSQHGASGLYFAELARTLEIADRVAPRATIIPAGFTAERLVTGEADVAIQQMSELLAVDGVDIVGPFPAEYQSATPFSAALFRDCANRSGAEAFLRLLGTEDAKRAYRQAGLEPSA